jgi:hypothetical protein
VPGQELAVPVVDDLLHEDLAQTLGEAPVELALGEERIDDRSGIVHPDEALDRQAAGLGLDADRADDGAERPHLGLGLEIRRGVEAGDDPSRRWKALALPC